MRVAGLWRYPVKSLGGEPLERAVLTSDGVEGDRLVHVRDDHGPLTGRTRHGLLTIPAGTGADGVPLVDGHRWDGSEARALVRAVAGEDAELTAYAGPERFDVGNLLVATTGSVDRFGHDVRRLRPNLLIEGAQDADLSGTGAALEIGDALVGIDSVRRRCIVTSIDPDTGAQDLDVFRRIRQAFDNRLALNAWVIRPGVVSPGDEVRLVQSDARPANFGGWVVGAPYQRVVG